MTFKKHFKILLCLSVFIIGFIGIIFIKNEKVDSLKETSKGLDKEVVEVKGLIPAKSRTEVVNDSEVIMRGKVKTICTSKWSNPDFEKGSDVSNILQTDIEFSVDKIYKGTIKNKETLTVRIDKGNYKNVVMSIDGYPDFVKNQDYLLFLSKDDGTFVDRSKEYYVLTGMNQGAYKSDGKGNYISEKVNYLLKLEKEQENQILEEDKEQNSTNDEKTFFNINTIEKELEDEILKGKDLSEKLTPE